MIRKSLEDLILVCRKIKVTYQVASYELNDYEDGSFADFRLTKVDSVGKLAQLTNDFVVSIYEKDGKLILRIYENYLGE